MKPINSIAIYLSWPEACLSPNARAHWGRVAGAKKRMRAEAKLLVREVLGRARPPMWKEAWVAIDAFPATRRKRDRDNLKASLKAAFDGLEDAGVVENDTGFDYKPVRIGAPAPENPGVWLTIYEKLGIDDEE